MAPTFSPGYIAPGFYVQQLDISTPNVPQGARIPAFIGQGAKTLVRSQVVTRGAVANGTDGPLVGDLAIAILSIIDANNVTYEQGLDFVATRSGDDLLVDWAPKATVTGTADLTALTYPGDLDGKKVNFVIDGVATNPAVTLTAPATAADVVAQINAWVGSTVATLTATKYLTLTGNSVVIADATGNTLLGLVSGDESSVKKPVAGLTYQVLYTSDKVASEYAPKLFSNMNDIIAYYGPKSGRTTLYSGTATAVTSSTLSDTALALTVDALIGKYIKITAGPGKGQVRVILSNTATQVTVSKAWVAASIPDTTSTYAITDVNENSITLGAQIGFDTGATFAMGSQYQDDIFNDANIKLAIDNLENDVQGQNPDCLVLMRGLGVSETSPLTYLKNHCIEMSNQLNNKFRVAIVGLASGNEDYTDFVNIANGTKSRRITIPDITSVNRDFGDGVSLLLDGSYVAAAIAGVYCAFVDAGEPITRKSIANAFDVDVFVDPFITSEKNAMAAAGILVVERQGTDLRIRHALTTDNTSIFTQELKLTRSADYISKYLRSNLENTLTGQRFVVSPSGGSDVVQTAKVNFTVLLEALKNPQAQIITGFDNLSVAQNQTEKRQLDFTANIYLTTEVLWEFALLGFTV